MRICTLLVFVIVLVAQTNAGCEGYDPQSPSQQVSETLTSCAPFVSQQVYISSNVTLTYIAANLTTNNVFQIIKNVTSILPLKCYKHVMGMLCQSAFPSCVGDSAVYPCKSMCEATLEVCGNIWSHVGLSVPFDCASNPVVGGAFPSSSCSNTHLPVTPHEEYSNPIISKCPTVYDFTDNPDDNKALCAMRCPDPGYTPAEYKKTNDFFVTIATISIVLQLYLIFSYLIDIQKRQFPARVHLFLFISNLGYALASLFSAGQKTMCASKTEYSTQDTNSLCAAQAFFLILFSYAAIFWVCVLSVITFLCVVLEKRPQTLKKYEKYIHLGLWGWILTCLCIICGMHSLDFGFPTRAYCYIKVDPNLPISIDFPLLYIPVVISVFITFMLLIACVTKLLIYRKSGGAKGAAAEATLKAQKRIIIVIAMLTIIFGIAFGFRFTTTPAGTKRTIDERTQWINCKLRSELLGFAYPSECDNDINPLRRSLGSVMFQNTLPALGIFIFFAFGTDKRMFLNWVTLARYLYNKEYDKVKKSIFKGSSNESTITPPPNPRYSRSSATGSGSNSISSHEEIGRSSDTLVVTMAPDTP